MNVLDGSCYLRDQVRGHFLLLGGFTAEGLSDELWAYDDSLYEWDLLCPQAGEGTEVVPAQVALDYIELRVTHRTP